MIRVVAFFLLLAAVVYSQSERETCVGIKNRAGIYLSRVSTNCSLYDVCNGKMYLATMSCGLGLVFSSTYSVCVYENGPLNDCKKTGPTGGFYTKSCRTTWNFVSASIGGHLSKPCIVSCCRSSSASCGDICNPPNEDTDLYTTLN